MSYVHIEQEYNKKYNHKITFRSELDYYLCKASYLKFYTDTSFSFFVERGFYDKSKIVVESIEHVSTNPEYFMGLDNASPGEASWAVMVQVPQTELLNLKNGDTEIFPKTYFSNTMFSDKKVIKAGEEKPKKKKFSRFNLLDLEE